MLTPSLLYKPVLSIHCYATLDLVAGVEQPFNCLIMQNCQTMQSMGKLMDWALDDNTISLFFCTTLTSNRMGHTPFV